MDRPPGSPPYKQPTFVSKLLRPNAVVEPYRSSTRDRPEFDIDNGKVAIIGMFNSFLTEPTRLASRQEVDDYKLRIKVPLYPFQTVPTVIYSLGSLVQPDHLEDVLVCTMRALLFRQGEDVEKSFRIAMWGILQYIEMKFYYSHDPESFAEWRKTWVAAYDRYDRVLMLDLLHNGKFPFVGTLNAWQELIPEQESNFGLALYVDLVLLLMRDFNVDPGQILYSFYTLYPTEAKNPIGPNYPARMVQATPFEVFGM